MRFVIRFVFLLALCSSCSTYKIAKHVINHKLQRSGLSYKQIDLGKYHLNYWDSEEDKPVLILVHGFGSSTQFQWSNQVEALHKNYRLILPNLIYFGGSSCDSSVTMVNEQVYALQALIEKLGIKKYSLCGVSYGGLVAAELGLRDKGSIQKMILCDAPVKYLDDKDVQLICAKYHEKSVADLLIPDNYKKLKPLMGIAYAHPPNPPLILFRSFYENMYNTQREGKQRLIQGLEIEKADFKARTYGYKFPVLLIWGAEDQLIPVSVGRLLLAHLGANARLEIIPNTAHMPSLENPDAFNAIVLKFLEQ